jgi:hypothetical protein
MVVMVMGRFEVTVADAFAVTSDVAVAELGSKGRDGDVESDRS